MITKSEKTENLAEDLKDYFPDSNIEGLVVRRRKASSSNIEIDEGFWEATPRERACSIDVGRASVASVMSDQDVNRGFRKRSDVLTEISDFDDPDYKMVIREDNKTQGVENGAAQRRRAVSFGEKFKGNETESEVDSRSGRSTASIFLQAEIESQREGLGQTSREELLRGNPEEFITKRKTGTVKAKVQENIGYKLKMKVGRDSKILKVKNHTQKAFSTFYESDDLSHLLGSGDINLWEVMVENDNKRENKEMQCFGKKRSKKQGLLEKRVQKRKSMIWFLRKISEESKMEVPRRPISPPIKRNTSKTGIPQSFYKNEEPIVVKKIGDTSAIQELERKLEGNDDSFDDSPPLMLKSMISGTQLRYSGGHFFSSANKLSGYLNGSSTSFKSMDLDLNLHRVNSLNNVSKYKSGDLSFTKSAQKYRVLESHKDFTKCTIDMVIVMNEGTALKIRVHNPDLAVLNNYKTQERRSSTISFDLQQNEFFDSNSFFQTQENGSDAEEESVASSSDSGEETEGRYTILKFKPLLFTKDKVRKKLFLRVLQFVHKNIWFDSLHRFLELVNIIYSDLVSFYLKLLKDLQTSPENARIVDKGCVARLVVKGQIKRVDVEVSVSIFGNDLTSYYVSKGEEKKGFGRMRGNSRTANAGKEFSACLAEVFSSHLQFVSSFI